MPSVNRVLSPTQFDRTSTLNRPQVLSAPPTKEQTLSTINTLENRVQDTLSLGQRLPEAATQSTNQLNEALQSLKTLTNSGSNASLQSVLERFQSQTLPQNLQQLRTGLESLQAQLEQLPAGSNERQNLELQLSAVSNTLEIYQQAESLFANSPILGDSPARTDTSTLTSIPTAASTNPISDNTANEFLNSFSPQQREILSAKPELVQALQSRLKDNPSLQTLFQQFQSLLKSPNPSSEEILGSLQFLIKAQPEANILKELLPASIQPLAKVILENPDSYLQKTLLSDPAKLERFTQNLTSLLDDTIDSKDLLAGIELLALSRDELKAISTLLPKSGAVNKLFNEIQTNTEFLSKTGLADPDKREKIIKQLETVSQLKEGELPGKDQLLAIAGLIKAFGSELDAVKGFLPASAQKSIDALLKTLNKYKSLDPKQLEKFIESLSTLSDDEVNADDAKALINVIAVAGSEAKHLKELLPPRLQPYLERLLDERVLKVFDVLNGKEFTAVLEASLSGQSDKATTGFIELLQRSGNTLLEGDGKQAVSALVEALPLDEKTQKLAQEVLASGDQDSIRRLAETLKTQANDLGKLVGSLPLAAPTPNIPAATPVPETVSSPGDNQLVAESSSPRTELETPSSDKTRGVNDVPTQPPAELTPSDAVNSTSTTPTIPIETPLSPQGQENLDKAVKKLSLSEADTAIARNAYANLSEKEAKTLTRALEGVDGPMRSNLLALYEKLPSALLTTLLENKETFEAVTKGLSSVIGSLDKLKIGFQVALPKLISALEKAVPIIGGKIAYDDAQRLMGIAQTGVSSQKDDNGNPIEYKDPTIRALALLGADLNTADAGIALLETVGIGLAGFGPQIALGLGAAGLEIIMEVYREDPSKIPTNVREGVKALALTQALVDPQAAAIVKDIYGVEGTAAILTELGDSIEQLDETGTKRSALVRIVALKDKYPEGIVKSFITDVAEKGGVSKDFLLNQLKQGALKIEDLFDKTTGKLSAASRELLTRFAASSADAAKMVFTALIAQPSDELFQFARAALDSGLLKLEDIVAGINASGGITGKGATLLLDLFKSGKVQFEELITTVSKFTSDPAVLKNFALEAIKKTGDQLDTILDLAHKAGVDVVDLLKDAVSNGLISGRKALSAVEEFVKRNASSLGSKGAEILERTNQIFQQLIVRPAQAAASAVGTAGQTVVQSAKEVYEGLQSRFKNVMNQLENIANLSADEVRRLLQEVENLSDELISALNNTSFGQDSKTLIDNLGTLYKTASNKADASLGAAKEALNKIAKTAEDSLKYLAATGTQIGKKAAAVLNQVRSTFFKTVVRNEDEFAQIASRLGLESLPDSFKKLLSGLEGAKLEKALAYLAKLSPENMQRLGAVLNFLPDVALRNIFTVSKLGEGFIDAVGMIFDTLDSKMGKLSLEAIQSLAPKIAAGLSKTIPALGVIASGYDTVRTAKIFETGTDLDGKAYNEDARMLAYIASRINAADTVLGIAEFIPGVAILSAAPSIALAVASTTLDVLTDYYNTNPMPPEMQGTVLLGAQALAVATLDAPSFLKISSLAGNQSERIADALVELISSKKPQKEVDAFVKSLSDNWSQNDDITRMFLRKLEKNGLSVSDSNFSDRTLKLLFDNLNNVYFSRTDQDYQDMKALAMAGGVGIKAYAINELMDQITNDSEEQIIIDLLSATPKDKFNSLMDELDRLQPKGKDKMDGAASLIYELKDNPARLMNLARQFAKKSDRLDNLFSSNQLRNSQVIQIGKTLLDEKISLTDNEKLALFRRAAAEGDLTLVETLLKSTKDAGIRSKMISSLSTNLTNFQSFFSANTSNAGKVAGLILAYGDSRQIETAFTQLNNSFKSYFGRGADIIKQAIDYANKNGIRLSGNKLTPTILQNLLGNLDSDWSKVFGGHTENLIYVKQLANLSDDKGKAQILRGLMRGWTPADSEQLMFEILHEASPQTFRFLVDSVGAGSIANELKDPSLSTQERARASKRLGNFMADLVRNYPDPNGKLNEVLNNINGPLNIMADDIVQTMTDSLYQRDRNLLKRINNNTINRLANVFGVFNDGNFTPVNFSFSNGFSWNRNFGGLDPESQMAVNRLKASRR